MPDGKKNRKMIKKKKINVSLKFLQPEKQCLSDITDSSSNRHQRRNPFAAAVSGYLRAWGQTHAH